MRPICRSFPTLLLGLSLFFLASTARGQFTPIRPPATPLIVRNPYVSVWQPADTLPGTWPAFWNGSAKAICGIARVDGKPYIFMGAPEGVERGMTQTGLLVTPTQSRYTLEGGGVRLTLDFLSPVEAGDLRRLSMPFGYLFSYVDSIDGKTHRVSLYFDISGEWAHGDPKTPITWSRKTISSESGGQAAYTAFAITPAAPQVLGENNEYPMWGTAVFATAGGSGVTSQAGRDDVVRARGAGADSLDNSVDTQQPRAINDHWPVFAFSFYLGSVGPAWPFKTGGRQFAPVLILGHVRDPAVSYLGKPVPPLWKSYWPDWRQMLAFAFEDAAPARERADRLDKRITADASRVGGPHYAALCALALRQAFGATELVGTAAQPWMFLKEISSDGNISTVDVVYPAFPVFLYMDPRLLGLLLDPLLAYAETGGWPKPFAEHDIGAAYPNANGHNDGNEEDMPVEESANMLIMVAAYLRYADPATAAAYAKTHYSVLKQWADYEAQNGLDPAYQNQTDDFTGFIKSSANLALKAILGVGAMGQIATHAGNAEDARHYTQTARDMIGKWTQLAQSNTGDHLVLAYGQDATWSLKYNAFPDKVLGLDLIPERVLNEEARYYTTMENPFGIPLDGRHTYTKTDWELWTAAATDDPALRRYFIDAVYRFADTSGFRGAFTDWYDTISGRQVGFVARPVIGGVFSLLARTMPPLPNRSH
ncbi:MAG TPA: DUF4965 domain-containing protein [Chthonomonadaceae bacterium]|nr:DUF4965 domain-containing protein [Chthonomonadaceae bacterium]